MQDASLQSNPPPQSRSSAGTLATITDSFVELVRRARDSQMRSIEEARLWAIEADALVQANMTAQRKQLKDWNWIPPQHQDRPAHAARKTQTQEQKGGLR